MRFVHRNALFTIVKWHDWRMFLCEVRSLDSSFSQICCWLFSLAIWSIHCCSPTWYPLILFETINNTSFLYTGESIQIFAEIENCSSRMVVPKAAIYQTQTFFAKGKMKEIKQLVANIRGESLSSGKTETWNGKMLKIPPVSPSILDCSIIRVEYSLMVRAFFFFFDYWSSLHVAGIFYSLKM